MKPKILLLIFALCVLITDFSEAKADSDMFRVLEDKLEQDERISKADIEFWETKKFSNYGNEETFHIRTLLKVPKNLVRNRDFANSIFAKIGCVFQDPEGQLTSLIIVLQDERTDSLNTNNAVPYTLSFKKIRQHCNEIYKDN